VISSNCQRVTFLELNIFRSGRCSGNLDAWWRQGRGLIVKNPPESSRIRH